MKIIGKAVVLTMREQWFALHGKQKIRPRPCDYPGFICDLCPAKHKRNDCWDLPMKVNNSWKIRRVQ